MNSLRIMLTILAFGIISNASLANEARKYDFKVLLDDREIGHHRFVVSEHNNETRILSEARFDVKFWFITAYTYLHTSQEVWQGGCLQSIEASTDDNGDDLFVRGESSNQSLKLQTHDGVQPLQGCIRTFAYWNPSLLENTKLLNAQTGILETVTFKLIGESRISVRGQPVTALHYQILNPKFSIDLWYSGNSEWLALESTTESGARLRYQAL
jgi:Family of unknown function (DUF6134)